MQVSLLIAKEVIEMFCMIAVGVTLVRTKILNREAGTYLSQIALNVILPCVIINIFQVKYTAEIKNGLISAFILAVASHVVLIFLPYILKRCLKLSAIEQASLSYPNSGEILIPLVISILSKEMQVYCCAFLIVQIILIFTHGECLISGQNKLRFKSILKNKNVIAIIVALIIFCFRIPLPSVVTGVLDSFSGMLAPTCMLAIGISIGTCNFKDIFAEKRTYLICFLRLIVMPVFILTIIKISHIVNIFDKEIILVVFMATASSVSATVTNMAYCYEREERKASAINVMSVLFLIVTLPLLVGLYYILL